MSKSPAHNAAEQNVDGLPEPLPTGERLLWQGRPDWRSVAVHVFHVRKVAIYFAALFAWRFAADLWEGRGVADALVYAAWILPLAIAAIALLTLFGFLAAWTAVYTVTDRRIVMRIGIALSMTVNLPYRVIDAASVSRHADGSGDLAFVLEPGTRASYAVLWPHARRWRLARPEPALRSIPDVDRVARIVAGALAAAAEPLRAHQAAPVPSQPRPERETAVGAGRPLAAAS
jgi:hypothetical protein